VGQNGFFLHGVEPPSVKRGSSRREKKKPHEPKRKEQAGLLLSRRPPAAGGEAGIKRKDWGAKIYILECATTHNETHTNRTYGVLTGTMIVF